MQRMVWHQRTAMYSVGALVVGAVVAVSWTPSSSAHTMATRAPIQYASGTAAWYNAAEGTVMSPQFIDWNGDGHRDAIDRGLLFVNAGDDETPVFSSVGTAMSTPDPDGWLIDWDDDGDHDFLTRYDLHLHENTGTDSAPVWVDSGELSAGGQPITSEFASYVRWNLNQSPSFSFADWDNDGDRDLIVGIADRVDVGVHPDVYTEGWIFVFENVGTSTTPSLASGDIAHTSVEDVNVPFKATIATADWNADGDLDILYGDYRGDVWFLERDGGDVLPAVRILDTGDITAWLDVADRDGDADLDLIVTSTSGMLLVENTGSPSAATLTEVGFVQMPATGVDAHVGIFQSPFVVDWEADGDVDLIVGDENGRISLFENTATGSVPTLVAAVPVLAGGAPINLDSDDTVGSWEWGPSEAAAGYTNPVLVDWDADGDLDIITQDAQAASLWFYENSGTRSAPAYDAGVKFTLDGNPFAAPWRCRVAAMDWDGDGTLELVQAGADNILTVFQRTSSGMLDLTAIAVAEDAASQPISVASSRPGRTNLQAVDWDGDGLTDLLQGAYGNTPLSWLRNVGTTGQPVFEIQYIRNADYSLYETISNHSPKTFAVDWDSDGITDLVDAEVWGSMYLVDGAELAHEPVHRHPSRLESESLPIAATSGDPLSVFSDAGASAGATLRYEATADGDYVSVDAGSLPAGDYRVVTGMRVAPNRGIVQVSIDGVAAGTPIDAHSTTVGYQEFDLGIVSIPGGQSEIRFTVTGKNAASSTRSVYVDYVDLIPRFEAENLALSASSGDALTVYSHGGASAGGTAHYAANAVGDYVTLSSPPMVAGQYRLLVGMRVAPNRGMVQAVVNGTAVGSPIDAHSATVGYQVFDLGVTSVDGVGSRDIRFTVTGKNAASSTYAVYVDFIEFVPLGDRFETEILARTGSSGDALGMFEDAAASEGATAQLSANTVGDYVTYDVVAPMDASYDVSLGFRVAANRGIVQLYVDGVALGSPIDTHSPTAGYSSFAVGSTTLTAGEHEFRIEVTGKNASSATFAVFPDFIDLIPN